MDPDHLEDGARNQGPRLYTALGCYAALGLAAGLTLDGNFRLVVWLFLAVLAVRTYTHSLRKP